MPIVNSVGTKVGHQPTSHGPPVIGGPFCCVAWPLTMIQPPGGTSSGMPIAAAGGALLASPQPVGSVTPSNGGTEQPEAHSAADGASGPAGITPTWLTQLGAPPSSEPPTPAAAPPPPSVAPAPAVPPAPAVSAPAPATTTAGGEAAPPGAAASPPPPATAPLPPADFPATGGAPLFVPAVDSPPTFSPPSGPAPALALPDWSDVEQLKATSSGQTPNPTTLESMARCYAPTHRRQAEKRPNRARLDRAPYSSFCNLGCTAAAPSARQDGYFSIPNRAATWRA